MRTLFLLAFVIGVAYCAPQLMYYELEYKPVLAPQALAAAAAAARPSEVEIFLAAQQAAAGVPAQPVRGFIKHEIPQPGGRESIEVLYPFDFPQAAPAAPAVPAVPAAPAPVPKDDDDDDHDD
ncbi:dihydrolipoyllysine-residue succinyltransferase component of 2-oxoglutarate dehydrogenase complex-like isoform X1 [Sinocyclocheilus grahami]|uniref:Secretory calcium-binding phosphoprotein 7 n=1 Tax=Sinocyclocheilus grahami TaxID=75366 RepID=A0A672QLF1_SINGR|nr:PREDICTED: dihydrolipoyllysine-residue succinyltransferase component of 2-oxoglutarate dehydrogenase complex-like isoform X1 [Sinocyclocheilus grahami]